MNTDVMKNINEMATKLPENLVAKQSQMKLENQFKSNIDSRKSKFSQLALCNFVKTASPLPKTTKKYPLSKITKRYRSKLFTFRPAC